MDETLLSYIHQLIYSDLEHVDNCQLPESHRAHSQS